jgi:hypothetical protein
LGQFGIVLDLAKSNNKNYNPKNQLFTVLQLFFPTPAIHAAHRIHDPHLIKRTNILGNTRHGVVVYRIFDGLALILPILHCILPSSAVIRVELGDLSTLVWPNLFHKSPIVRTL